MARERGPASVFAKERLRPSQLRTVADRRWGDADYLRNSGFNQRANGAMYVAGFVLECLLKARLLEKHPWLQSKRQPDGLSRQERALWFLCYRSHDLTEMLERLPEVVARMQALDRRSDGPLFLSLKSICSEWTIFVRYSPRSATMDQANDFLNQIAELRKWLA